MNVKFCLNDFMFRYYFWFWYKKKLLIWFFKVIIIIYFYMFDIKEEYFIRIVYCLFYC